MSVACVGEALVVMVQSEAGPLEDCVSFERSLGGAEMNVAIALAAHGVEARVITRVGNDGFGRYVKRTLEEYGVGTAGITIDPIRSTGIYLKEVGGATGLLADLGTTNSRMHYYRTDSASSALSVATLRDPQVAQVLGTSSAIHSTGITAAISASSSAALTVIMAERSPDQLMSFDLNWREALWRGRRDEAAETLGSHIAQSDLALLGRGEALAVFGTDDPDALRELFPEPRWLVVKNDAQPAVGFDGRRKVEVAAPQSAVVETIGAGDAFAAGAISALQDGADISGALVRAHASAARALRSLGDHIGAARA